MLCGNFTEPTYLRSPELVNELNVSAQTEERNTFDCININFVRNFADSERYV